MKFIALRGRAIPVGPPNKRVKPDSKAFHQGLQVMSGPSRIGLIIAPQEPTKPRQAGDRPWSWANIGDLIRLGRFFGSGMSGDSTVAAFDGSEKTIYQISKAKMITSF